MKTMKSLLSVLSILVSFSLTGQDPRLSDIETSEELATFIEDALGYDYQIAWTVSSSPNLPAIKVKRNADFQKVDLDKNGRLDLIVNDITCPFALLALETGEFEKYRLCGKEMLGWLQYNIMPVDTAHSPPLILLQKERRHDIRDSLKDTLDTLIYKYGSFVEYNPGPSRHQIDTIWISTTHCFGPCPVFDLEIRRDGMVHFVGKEHTSKLGSYSDTISEDKFEDLSEVLNYSGFNDLRQSYSASHTDDQTAELAIHYDGDKKIRISDYGLSGTRALSIFYERVFALLEDKKWK